MKAYRLRQVDEQYKMHMAAWLHNAAGATKNVGSDKKPKEVPVYKNFKDFFDYEKEVNEAKGIRKKKLSKTHRKMAHLAFLVNSGKGVKHE